MNAAQLLELIHAQRPTNLVSRWFFLATADVSKDAIGLGDRDVARVVESRRLRS
jgi:hypothetical protein